VIGLRVRVTTFDARRIPGARCQVDVDVPVENGASGLCALVTPPREKAVRRWYRDYERADPALRVRLPELAARREQM